MNKSFSALFLFASLAACAGFRAGRPDGPPPPRAVARHAPSADRASPDAEGAADDARAADTSRSDKSREDKPREDKPREAIAPRFRHVELGKAIGQISRWPLSQYVCDIDAIDKKSRVVAFLASCNGAMPQGSVVAIYSKYSAGAEAAHAELGEVDAVAWFHGDWIARSFPAHIGDDHRALDERLGRGEKLFDFAKVIDGGEHIVVYRRDSTYSIERDGVAVGFVVGTMGTDRTREEWRGLLTNSLRALDKKL